MRIPDDEGGRFDSEDTGRRHGLQWNHQWETRTKYETGVRVIEMGPEGLEPSTPSLKGSCSTIELQSRNHRTEPDVRTRVLVCLARASGSLRYFYAAIRM